MLRLLTSTPVAARIMHRLALSFALCLLGAATAQAQAYFIAPSGGVNSSTCTTRTNPCATTDYVQAMMQNGSIKTVYFMAGTYRPTTQIQLTNADNGETWAGDPNGNWQAVVFDGQSALEQIFLNLGASNVTWNNFTAKNVLYRCIGIHGGGAAGAFGAPSFNVNTTSAADNTVSNIECDNITGGTNYYEYDNGGIVAAEGYIPNLTINHVVMDGAADMGIEIEAQNGNYKGLVDSISGTVVENSVFLNTMKNLDDGAPIYMHDWLATSTNISVKNNFMRGYIGTHSAPGSDEGQTFCVYLDSSTSNVAVSGNVCAPPGNPPVTTQNFGVFMVNCGRNNTFTDNIIDLGIRNSNYGGLYLSEGTKGGQASGQICGSPFVQTAMTGNTFENNIIVSNFSAPYMASFGGVTGYAFIGASPGAFPAAPTIRNNWYFNYSTGGVYYNGVNMGPDTAPQAGNPSFNTNGYLYTLNSGAGPLSAPTSFIPIVGGWGPPGYVIPAPTAALAPSY